MPFLRPFLKEIPQNSLDTYEEFQRFQQGRVDRYGQRRDWNRRPQLPGRSYAG